jgi:hypothetical protein
MIFEKTEFRHPFEVDIFNDVIGALSNYKTGEHDSCFLMSKCQKMNGFE